MNTSGATNTDVKSSSDVNADLTQNEIQADTRTKYASLYYIWNKNGGGTVTHTWKKLWFITWNHEYSVTIGDKTVVYSNGEVYEIGNHWIINTSYLTRDFGLTSEQASHQPGDVFDSMDDAALAWALTYYLASNNPNDRREYGSAIYENGNGFSFSEPNVATGNTPFERMNVTIPFAPDGYTAVAGIHSHPNEPSNAIVTFDHENFSTYDNGGDLYGVHSSGLPLYLVTPSGKVKLAENKDRSKRTFNITTPFSGIDWYK